MCGLEIAGKVAAFVEETEPVLLSTVVIRQPGREDGRGRRKERNETEVSLFPLWERHLAQFRRAHLGDRQEASVSVPSSVKWASWWGPLDGLA